MTQLHLTLPRRWSNFYLLFFWLAFFHLQTSLASTITVKKVKGNSAVIEMSSALEVGKTYNLEGDTLTVQTDYTSQFKSRFNSVSLGLDLSMINANKVVDNSASFKARYGWNHRSFEFGPVINLSLYDKGFGTNTDYLVGAFLDYNLIDNKAPRDLIYGTILQIMLGNRAFDTGGSAQVTQGSLGGFVTWFINNSPVALRSEVSYLYRRVNSSSSETTLNGLTGQVYLIYYF